MASCTRNHYCILILDDNPSHTELLREYFEEHAKEFQLEICHDVGAFFHRVEKERYDLFLIDFRLPGCSGLDVVRHLRQQRVSTPVVLMSGAALQDLGISGNEEGIQGFISKSRATFESLPRLLHSHMNHTQGGLNL